MFLFLLVLVLIMRCSCRGDKPPGIEIVMHRKNPKFTHAEDTQDSECNQIEIVLRSFTIDMETHFLREWRVARETLAIKNDR